ncbi:MAG TPA: D-glycero-beta-D-manno-heptose 1-phosphate adenylyltransferase, partial [Thermomicrobiales bacterium]|nr:D-glycero-beta-D-manno-heptose 1-phosphate adenylyltransferase [Thermomicrobiales bacterium]
AGVVGADADGELVRQMLRAAEVDHQCLLVDDSRPTTVKERFIGRAQGRHPHQILRVDSEVRDPIGERLQREILERVVGEISAYDVVLVSEYDKGVCTPRLLETVIQAARRAGVPLLVDPIRSRDYSRYRGATSMTPNRLEAELATGLKIAAAEDAFAAADRLRRELQLEFGIITLDRDGMALVDATGQGSIFPTRPRAVYDITGAGDMALAMIGVSLAAGVAAPQALRLGNIAAGLEVEKIGVAVIPRAEIRARLFEEQAAAERERAAPTGGCAVRSPQAKILPLDELALETAQRRAAGQRIVFTNGCFDLLHVGHVSYLAEARAQGELLIVGLNSDASVRRLKGPTRPVIRQQDRAAMLAALAAVDYVVVFDEPTPHRLLHHLRPDVLVKGGAYRPEEVVGHEVVEAYGGKVGVLGHVAGVSTTAILASLGAGAVSGPHFDPASSESRQARKAS